MTMQYDNLEDKLSQLVEYTKDSGKPTSLNFPGLTT